MGFGVIRLLHKDIADVLLKAVTALRFDPENRFVNVLLEKSALLSPDRLKEISFAIFLYAALDIIEGTGLVLEKVWAEYFTLILTGSFLPWEIYEIIRHVTVLKIVLTLLNLARLYLSGPRGQREGKSAPATVAASSEVELRHLITRRCYIACPSFAQLTSTSRATSNQTRQHRMLCISDV